ncbi:MAG: hypothetical protein ACI8TX_001936 [Hyphomicrobiaceae bacterium]|jgi:hypothetical protein
MVTSTTLPPPRGTFFTDITPRLDFRKAVTGWGASFVDVDGDGFDDAVFPGFENLQILRNRGDGTFDPAIVVSEPEGWGLYVYSADIVGDSAEDLVYVLNTGTEVLERTAPGVFNHRPAYLPDDPTGYLPWVLSFADFGSRGHLDLYVSRFTTTEPDVDPKLNPCELVVKPILGAPDLLLRFNGSSYEDVTAESGVSTVLLSQAVATADIDGDEEIDLLVGIDRDVDRYFVQQPDDTFVDERTAFGIDQESAAMGFSVADVDGDLVAEILITDIGDNWLLVRQPDGNFANESVARGLGAPNGRTSGWGNALQDFDNDGDVDVDAFAVNGSVAVGLCGDPDFAWQRNEFYLNDGTGQFQRIIDAPAHDGLQVNQSSRAAAFVDIDHDGDINVLISNMGGPTLLRNEMGSAGNWIQLKLIDGDLAPPVGASVLLSAAGRVQKRWVVGTPSFGGSSSRWIHFGLGDATAIDSIMVTWPDGSSDQLEDQSANRFAVISKTAATNN